MNRFYRSLFGVIFLISTLCIILSCGGGASGPVTPTSMPIAVEFLDGATGVDADASFQYQFPQEMDAGTIDTSSFFIVTGSNTNIATPMEKTSSSTTCDAPGLPAVVSLSSDGTTAQITPESALGFNTPHGFCLKNTIKDSAGNLFKGENISMTTKAQSDASKSFISKIEPYGYDKLPTEVKLTFTKDPGTNDDPIVSIKSKNEYSDPAEPISGTWAYGSETTSRVFTPSSGSFELCDTIAIKILAIMSSLPRDVVPRFTTRYTYTPKNDFKSDADFRSVWGRCWTTNDSRSDAEKASTSLELGSAGNGLKFEGTGIQDMTLATKLEVRKLAPYKLGWEVIINFSGFSVSNVDSMDKLGLGVQVVSTLGEGQSLTSKSVILYSYTSAVSSQSQCAFSITDSTHQADMNYTAVDTGNLCDFSGSNNGEGSIKVIWDSENVTFKIKKKNDADFTTVGTYALEGTDIDPSMGFVSLSFFYKGVQAGSQSAITIDSVEFAK